MQVAARSRAAKTAMPVQSRVCQLDILASDDRLIVDITMRLSLKFSAVDIVPLIPAKWSLDHLRYCYLALFFYSIFFHNFG